jgi:hypothetical protein
MPHRAIFREIVSDRLSTFLLASAIWLAVVASVGKVLPDIGRKLPERVAKLV